MAIPILNHLDLRSVSELQNAILHKTTEGSASNVEGKIIYDTGTDSPKVYNGSSWIDLGGDIRQVKVIADDSNSYDVIKGNFVLTISGDTGISTTLSGSTLEIDLDNTAVTPNSYGSATAIPTFTVDQQGRLTAAGSESIATALTVDGDSGAANVDLLTDDLRIIGTSNEIETASSKSGTDVSLQIGLPNNVTIGNNLTVTTDLSVDGVSNLDNTDIDGTLVVDGSNISLDSTSTLNIDNSSTTNGITIGTATSGVPISIGHTTSQVTVNDNLTVTGDLIVTGDTKYHNETIQIVEDNTLAFRAGDGDSHEILLTAANADSDKTITLPNKTGTVALTTDITDRQFTTTIGNASVTTINLLNSGASAPHKNHGLGADSTQFMIQLIEVSTGLTVMADVARGTSGAVAITFASAPAANAIRVLMTKIG